MPLGISIKTHPHFQHSFSYNLPETLESITQEFLKDLSLIQDKPILVKLIGGHAASKHFHYSFRDTSGLDFIITEPELVKNFLLSKCPEKYYRHLKGTQTILFYRGSFVDPDPRSWVRIDFRSFSQMPLEYPVTANMRPIKEISDTAADTSICASILDLIIMKIECIIDWARDRQLKMQDFEDLRELVALRNRQERTALDAASEFLHARYIHCYFDDFAFQDISGVLKSWIANMMDPKGDLIDPDEGHQVFSLESRDAQKVKWEEMSPVYKCKMRMLTPAVDTVRLADFFK
ncbi:uncharacterized protein BT62DRAFT_919519 [Guyanagaster necrorhizus]|uniref:Uncharacterized protein n=1 Tax=Guyanagaster necrorhizus TaxID=856835 RepID=A0A9P7VTA1_9AGAR|nr:uncharacterized protein BT62DRAFT_919519 [Guyanagaster necrorhizus MCA 3950]KAG7447013.1 hypothetical protein BT62DRAFT_919519 [Guyanagaster necrorhizus MCA 3950]